MPPRQAITQAVGDGRGYQRPSYRAKSNGLMGVMPSGGRVVFTSGATEANNMVLRGCGVERIIVSATEHPSVLNALPDPVFILLFCIGVLVAASVVADWTQWSAVNPVTGERLQAQSLLSQANVARLLVDIGDVPRARKVLEAAKVAAPTGGRPRLGLAVLAYQNQGDYAGASTELQALIEAKLEKGDAVDTAVTHGEGDDDEGGEVIDLMAALKASVERSRAARGGATAESAAKSAPKKAKPKSKAKKAS